MSHFTNEIIDQCEITSCKSYLDQGVHQKWVFEVFDPSTGEPYMLEDTTLGSDATGEQLKARVRELLSTTEHISIEENTSNVIPNLDIIGGLS